VDRRREEKYSTFANVPLLACCLTNKLSCRIVCAFIHGLSMHLSDLLCTKSDKILHFQINYWVRQVNLDKI
jgi:hypothetical protein